MSGKWIHKMFPSENRQQERNRPHVTTVQMPIKERLPLADGK
jgi:hypothetical protein